LKWKIEYIYGFNISDYKEIEEQLREAHEHIQIQADEFQVSNEELRVQSDELNDANALLFDSVIGFRTLAENSPDLIARFDRQNRCLYSNSAAKFYDIPISAEFYDRSFKEFIDETRSKMEINPEIAEISEKQRENVFITGKSETTEFQYTSSRGKK
jgi:PAS domain-containing protein